MVFRYPAKETMERNSLTRGLKWRHRSFADTWHVSGPSTDLYPPLPPAVSISLKCPSSASFRKPSILCYVQKHASLFFPIYPSLLLTLPRIDRSAIRPSRINWSFTPSTLARDTWVAHTGVTHTQLPFSSLGTYGGNSPLTFRFQSHSHLSLRIPGAIGLSKVE